jgi:Peroxiredoxin
MDHTPHLSAPEWEVERWFNAREPLNLESLRGKVVVLEAFQMLCPGCVMHGLPQAVRVHHAFPTSEVAVIGLHTVFEHHAAMTPVSLQAFLHEYRVPSPVAVDAPGEKGGVPRTMHAYRMQGTPTLILIDRQGKLRHHHLGQVADLTLGAEIAELMMERPSS